MQETIRILRMAKGQYSTGQLSKRKCLPVVYIAYEGKTMILDVRGKSCPIPLLRTRHHMAQMDVGDTIKVLSTDYGTIGDMRAFCDKAGHTLQSVTEQDCCEYDTVYVLVVVKR